MSSSRKRGPGRPAKYPPEFQRDAVAMVLDEGRAITDVARAIGVNEGTLGNWVSKCYDAKLGSFISVDPVAQPKLPVTLNPFAYSGANPLRYSDSTGLCFGAADAGSYGLDLVVSCDDDGDPDSSDISTNQFFWGIFTIEDPDTHARTVLADGVDDGTWRVYEGSGDIIGRVISTQQHTDMKALTISLRPYNQASCPLGPKNLDGSCAGAQWLRDYGDDGSALTGSAAILASGCAETGPPGCAAIYSALQATSVALAAAQTAVLCADDATSRSCTGGALGVVIGALPGGGPTYQGVKVSVAYLIGNVPAASGPELPPSPPDSGYEFLQRQGSSNSRSNQGAG